MRLLGWTTFLVLALGLWIALMAPGERHTAAAGGAAIFRGDHHAIIVLGSQALVIDWLRSLTFAGLDVKVLDQ